jgi:hypothetical protein
MIWALVTADPPLEPVSLSDDNGVDRAQIREMLQLTPQQRLARVQEFVESVFEIQVLNEAHSRRWTSTSFITELARPWAAF